MKATAKILCAICALTFSLITFTSCDNDIEDVHFLVGVWMHQDNDSRDYYQFNADGTGYEWEAPLSSSNGTITSAKESFRYCVSGNKITFVERHDNDIDVETIKRINENRIKIDGDIYNRQ